MKSLYENYKRIFTEAREIASSYGLPVDDFDKAISEIDDFRVTVPIIGKFSTGKSSLINAVIGQEILSTDITPETAIPAEIYFGNNKVTFHKSDNTTFEGTVSSLNTANVDVKNINLLTISLDNEFLSRIPSVKIVDMPGLGSGYETHNKAIDNYLPQSLAYIIAVDISSGSIEDSILCFLDELKLSNRLIYLVLTKAENVFDSEEIPKVTEHIKSTICRRIGLNDIPVAVTSAYEEEFGTFQFKKFLMEIQEKSDDIFLITYSATLKEQLNNIRMYLNKQLAVKNYDADKLEADKIFLEEKIRDIETEINKEKARFRAYSEECIASIQQRVESELNNQSVLLANMLVQGSDISGKVNNIVRNTITSEINSNFESKLQKYAENAYKLISVDLNCFSNCHIALSSEEIEQSQMLSQAIDAAAEPVGQAIVSTVAKAATGVVATGAAATGLSTLAGTSAVASGIVSFLTGSGAGAATGAASGAVLGPAGIAVGAVLGIVIGGLFKSGIKNSDDNKKREIARDKVREVIEGVKCDLYPKIRESINNIVDNADKEIDASKEQQILIQRNSIAAIENQLANSVQERQKYIERINRDLKRLDELEAGKEAL